MENKKTMNKKIEKCPICKSDDVLIRIDDHKAFIDCYDKKIKPLLPSELISYAGCRVCGDTISHITSLLLSSEKNIAIYLHNKTALKDFYIRTLVRGKCDLSDIISGKYPEESIMIKTIWHIRPEIKIIYRRGKKLTLI